MTEMTDEAMSKYNDCDCSECAPANKYWVCPKCDAEWTPETVEIVIFPKMCCGRPTQTVGSQSYCPICKN